MYISVTIKAVFWLGNYKSSEARVYAILLYTAQKKLKDLDEKYLQMVSWGDLL